jgi:hypothetical protein
VDDTILINGMNSERDDNFEAVGVGEIQNNLFLIFDADVEERNVFFISGMHRMVTRIEAVMLVR